MIRKLAFALFIAAAGSSTAAEGVFIGRLKSEEPSARVAVVIGDRNVVAYVCSASQEFNEAYSRWFRGKLGDDGEFDFASGPLRLKGRQTEKGIEGEIGGAFVKSQSFAARQVPDDGVAGLYRASEVDQDYHDVLGWIADEEGTVVGARRAGQRNLPAAVKNRVAPPKTKAPALPKPVPRPVARNIKAPGAAGEAVAKKAKSVSTLSAGKKRVPRDLKVSDSAKSARSANKSTGEKTLAKKTKTAKPGEKEPVALAAAGEKTKSKAGAKLPKEGDPGVKTGAAKSKQKPAVADEPDDPPAAQDAAAAKKGDAKNGQKNGKALGNKQPGENKAGKQGKQKQNQGEGQKQGQNQGQNQNQNQGQQDPPEPDDPAEEEENAAVAEAQAAANAAKQAAQQAAQALQAAQQQNNQGLAEAAQAQLQRAQLAADAAENAAQEAQQEAEEEEPVGQKVEPKRVKNKAGKEPEAIPGDEVEATLVGVDEENRVITISEDEEVKEIAIEDRQTVVFDAEGKRFAEPVAKAKAQAKMSGAFFDALKKLTAGEGTAVKVRVGKSSVMVKPLEE